MTRTRLVSFAAGLVLAVAPLAGCANLGTELDTLKPVAGDMITSLNIATNDVLVSEGVEILVAPVCTFDSEQASYTCPGKTVSGEAITATAQGEEPETMTVKVGTKDIYSGPIAAVIKKAGQR